MIEICDHFRRVTATISAKAAQAGAIEHAATIGQLREIIVSEFLRPLLPRHFEIRSGKIMDSTGAKSLQQDIIVVDSSMPLIDVGSSTAAVTIAESVIATIEVKSTLDKRELLSSLDSSTITKSLKRVGQLTYQKGPAKVIIPTPLPILTYVFAFDGIDPDTIGAHITDYAIGTEGGKKHFASEIIDAACILNRGVILNSPRMATVSGNTVQLPEIGDCTLTWMRLPKDSLYAFYHRLCSDITYLKLEDIDLDAYFTGAAME